MPNTQKLWPTLREVSALNAEMRALRKLDEIVISMKASGDIIPTCPLQPYTPKTC